jgi:NADPH2:quinone reductase
MKAVRLVPGPEGGRFEVQEIPTPVAAPGQVLVRVRASALNRGEMMLAEILRSGEPITNGIEFAGEVAALGEGVTGWRIGDGVMGHAGGGQAQYVACDARALMPRPERLSWVEAASFPNVFITAHDAVVSNGELKAGETMLVNGASGGVAIAALQIGALSGAKVIATSRSAEKLAKLRALGAHHTIDVSRQSQREVVHAITDGRGVDVIIDTLGGAVFEDNLKMLAVKGRLVHVSRPSGATAQIDLSELWAKRLKLVGVTFRSRTPTERLACVQDCARDVLPWLEAGRIQLPVDRVFPMDEVAAAYAYMAQDRHVGKIALAVG